MKRLMFLITALLAVSLILPVACAQAKAPVPSPVTTSAPGIVAPAPPAPQSAPGLFGRGSAPVPSITVTVPDSSKAAAPQAQTPDRMIIRNGDVSLVVKDVIQSRDDIAQLASRLEGYVVSSSIYTRDSDPRGSIAIRVPDSKFDQAFTELRKLAVRVTSERTNSQDVTEQYIDLQSRLKNAEATESQYLAILQKADKVADIVQVQEKLSQVRSEIEQIKGRMQYLERQAAMSLINVNLESETSNKPLASGGWNLIETVKSATRGFVVVGKWLLTALVWIVIFVPIWGTVLGVIYWRKRRQKVVS